jgi:hypothetical protein
MGAGHKKIRIIMQKLNILEIVYAQQKFEWEYLDKLDALRERLMKLPLLAQKNPNYFETELELCMNEVEDMLSILNPTCFDGLGLSGDVD